MYGAGTSSIRSGGVKHEDNVDFFVIRCYLAKKMKTKNALPTNESSPLSVSQPFSCTYLRKLFAGYATFVNPIKTRYACLHFIGSKNKLNSLNSLKHERRSESLNHCRSYVATLLNILEKVESIESNQWATVAEKYEIYAIEKADRANIRML